MNKRHCSNCGKFCSEKDFPLCSQCTKVDNPKLRKLVRESVRIL